ncbi:hypothetical protein LX87_04391 [Larkinella arboricola]|uniref:Uncharacterized protein n=1 Tax=Larkinella arboricola TaxID=643671 RepID=A0A327WQL8_LARAB|nr:hypothetical protein [Larkinella arboricola]RAJ94504.1 hypothetical protein LX87_04391 [Larkinella arboricola]
METSIQYTMSGSQADSLFNPVWSKHVQESFDLYHELDVLRDTILDPDTVQEIDDCLQHLLFTLNAVFVDMSKAPGPVDQEALAAFMRQISRRLQAENHSVKELLERARKAENNLFAG